MRPKLKDRSCVHLILVGSPDPRKHDPERTVNACDVEGCALPATQFHGPLHDPIYTCDDHAQEVIVAIVSGLWG